LPTKFDVQTTATLPRFLVRYALSGETNLYANYAKGNQPTQGYATFFQLSPAQQAVALKNGVSSTAPEAVVKNYEVGIKHRADDNSWYLNASVYYLEWIGRQGVRTIQVDLNGDGVITNLPAPAGENFNAVPFAAGDSNTRGVELDGAVSLTRNLTLGGNIAYADTKITKALNESLPLRFFGLADAKGFKFPLAPDFSGAMFLQYENAVSADRKWFARGDMTYIGKRYDSIVNFAYVPVQIRTNVRVGLKASNWEAAVSSTICSTIARLSQPATTATARQIRSSSSWRPPRRCSQTNDRSASPRHTSSEVQLTVGWGGVPPHPCTLNWKVTTVEFDRRTLLGGFGLAALLDTPTLVAAGRDTAPKSSFDLGTASANSSQWPRSPPRSSQKASSTAGTRAC